MAWQKCSDVVLCTCQHGVFAALRTTVQLSSSAGERSHVNLDTRPSLICGMCTYACIKPQAGISAIALLSM